MKNLIRVCILFFFVIGANNAFAEKMRIAVIDFQPKDVSKNVAMKVSELIRNEMVDVGKFVIIERAQMSAILGEHELAQSGCTDVSCAVEVGKLISARKILVGSVMQLGRKIIISGRIVDVEKGVAEFSTNQEASSQDDLFRAVKQFTKKLALRIEGKRVPRYTNYNQTRKYTQQTPADSTFFFMMEMSYLQPIGGFASVSGAGMGLVFAFGTELSEEFVMGVDIGSYMFFSVNDGSSSYDELMYMFPATLRVDYILSFGSFYFKPLAGVGGMYILYSGNAGSGFEPLVKGGAALGYKIGLGMLLEVDVSYVGIIETGGMVSMLAIGGGFGYKF
ncbi:MAG: hypothetical protein GY754_01570 [bacterium]|nr:hypothetical protein [bacterium]